MWRKPFLILSILTLWGRGGDHFEKRRKPNSTAVWKYSDEHCEWSCYVLTIEQNTGHYLFPSIQEWTSIQGELILLLRVNLTWRNRDNASISYPGSSWRNQGFLALASSVSALASSIFHICFIWGFTPSLSQPKFMLFGAHAPPRPEVPRLSAKALAALPPSLSVIDCSKLLCDTVCDSATGSIGHQHTSITTLDSCGPGAWTTAGKPEYYRLNTLSCGRDVSTIIVRFPTRLGILIDCMNSLNDDLQKMRPTIPSLFTYEDKLPIQHSALINPGVNLTLSYCSVSHRPPWLKHRWQLETTRIWWH
jgi:hypothetical protein